jgi:DNA processing protein
MTDNKYLTAVCAFIYFGAARVELLISYFKTAKKVWHAPVKELCRIGLTETKVKEFSDFRKSFDIESYFKRLSKLDIKVVTFLDDDFPKKLKELPGAPLLLYYKGSLNGLKANSVAIVGTRKMTSYGREVTEKFSGELASFGVTIISGLARGVDSTAHKACLSAGGITIAVLGNGLDTVYPPENQNLAAEIIKKGGALVSEYPLGYPALPINFAVRNRIVSGLSTCVLVVEGAEKSGTLLTASHAAEQGKTVFAVPGQITSPLSAAPLYLLKNGAKIATETKDILDELNMEVRVDKEKMEKVAPDNPEEAKLVELLENEPLHLDEIVRITGGKTSDISARLTIMEMKGFVRNLGSGKYKKL